MISTKQLTLMADGRYLCRELDIHFQTGEVWAILGKNGVGKTTLLHNLAGLKKPTAGQVWIDNFPIDKLNAKIRAQNVAILLQENKYQFPFTVEELVSQARFPYQHLWNTGLNVKDKNIIQQILTDLELTRFTHRSVTELSGGEQQRVRIACLFAQTPRIFLLDEPTTYLDYKIQLKLLKTLHQLAKDENKTVIQILHDPNLAIKHCDKLLLMFEDGKVLATSSDQVSAKMLEELYQIPFIGIENDDRTFWLPN